MLDFDDVEVLLYRGFLTLPVYFKNHTFLFKTVNLTEWRAIAEQGHPDQDELQNRSYNYIAYSLYTVDGINVLPNRRNDFGAVLDWAGVFPSILSRQILIDLELLNNRAKLAIEKVPAYIYTTDSVFYWKINKDKTINSEEVTGIAGTQYLGLNEVQKLWLVLNSMEQDNQMYESVWTYVKALISVWNPKHAQKLETHDKERHRKEQERRHNLLSGEPMDTPGVRGNIFVQKDSLDSMMEEEYKVRMGIKDKHDVAVESYERKIIEELKQQENRREELRKQMGDMDNLPGILASQEPISEADMLKRIQDQQKQMFKKIQKKIMQPESASFADEHRRLVGMLSGADELPKDYLPSPEESLGGAVGYIPYNKEEPEEKEEKKENFSAVFRLPTPEELEMLEKHGSSH